MTDADRLIQLGRKTVEPPARRRLALDEGTPDGTVFLPFAFREAAANLLTHAAIDPVGKLPELRFRAVRVVHASSDQFGKVI